METFTFGSQSILAEPAPSEIGESDPRWNLEFSRRGKHLESVRDESRPDWFLAASLFCHDTGSFADSLAYSAAAIRVFPKDRTVRARARLVDCLTYLAIADSAKADRCVHILAKLATTTPEPHIRAAHNFADGINRHRNYGKSKYPLPEVVIQKSAPALQEAVREFIEVQDFDFAVRAQMGLAALQFETGKFFFGVADIEKATELARCHGAWSMIGRILDLYAGTAADQGYREGVEQSLRRSIEWSNYLGDALGRVNAQTNLGRLLAYEVPRDRPDIAKEPMGYLQEAAIESNRLHLTWQSAKIESTRLLLSRKIGETNELEVPNSNANEASEIRQKLVAERTADSERVAEAIRRNTSLRLHDGIQDSPDPFFVFDAMVDDRGKCRDFNNVYRNRAATRIYDQSKNSIFLYSEARRLPPLKDLDDALERVVKHREAYEDQIEVDGGEVKIWLQRRLVPSGIGAVLTLRDVTAERRIESALRHAADQARNSELAKTTFLANMSHEIRTPLNGILGLARMLGETDLDIVKRAYVDDLIMSGDLLLDLIGNILDLTKIEAREMGLSPSNVSLRNLVASVMKLFSGQSREKQIRLESAFDDNVPDHFFADGVRLRQILSNLVGNAIKFTQEGTVRIHVAWSFENVIFEVSDTGVGIPTGHWDKIFGRFEQLEESSQRGTGLGLAITRGLVHLMGGQIGVTSKLGDGSVFRASIPLPLAAKHSTEPNARTEVRFHNSRVLLVDDNSVNLLVSAHALQKFGCEVVSVASGAEALECYFGDRFDLIFMDVRMPIMSGLDVTREIRLRESSDRYVPIVALTAGALIQEQQECFAAGMDDFITKPFALEDIERTLSKWLQ